MTAPLRFSTLKAMALSPLHFRHACDHELEPTRAMRIGTSVHACLLGGVVAVFDGTRRGKLWDAFKATHIGTEIVTADEQGVALNVAAAVLDDPTAGPLFRGPGVNEHRIDWSFRGVPFRSTPDRYIPSDGTLIELKTARTAEPGAFLRDALRRHYHAQVATYRAAIESQGCTVRRVLIVAVETTAPYAVTTIEVSPQALDLGYRAVCGWLERYQVHAAAGRWPGYSQSIVPWEITEDVELDFGDGAEAEDEAA